MAQKKPTIDVTGMSIHDIMNIDIETFNKLGEKDLRRITSRLVSASNKRIRALEKKELSTPAYRGLGTDVRFSTKLSGDMTASQRVNKIRQEFSRARNFLSLKTSTISGYKAVIKETKRNLSETLGLSPKQISSIDIGKGFEIFHKLQQSGVIPPKGSKGSDKMRDYIIGQMVENPDISEKTLMEKAQDYYNNQYEEQETEETEC